MNQPGGSSDRTRIPRIQPGPRRHSGDRGAPGLHLFATECHAAPALIRDPVGKYARREISKEPTQAQLPPMSVPSSRPAKL